ncbi:MAG TPA: Crp/Fnr family transcriptional regulator [Holophagaceae bacterium]|nr:Crp/Fnr family transcriptional regulator [Holophagaceae bacterium]
MLEGHAHLLNAPDADGLNLFESLPTGLWERLDRLKEIRTYTDNAYVYQQDEIVGGIFQLLEGEWKVVHSDARGFQQILEFLRPGAVAGIVPYFEGRPSCFSVRSLRRSRGFFIPGDEFKHWALTEAAGIDAVLHHFGTRLRYLMDVAHGLSLQTVPERLARVILQEHQRRPETSILEFQEDQGELGLHIGCTRAAVSRAFKLLADMGLIRSTFPVVKVLDIPTLQRMAKFRPDKPIASPDPHLAAGGRPPTFGGWNALKRGLPSPKSKQPMQQPTVPAGQQNPGSGHPHDQQRHHDE